MLILRKLDFRLKMRGPESNISFGREKEVMTAKKEHDEEEKKVPLSFS